MSNIKCFNPSNEQLQEIKKKGWHNYANNGVKVTLSDADIINVFTQLQSQANNPLVVNSPQSLTDALTQRASEIRQEMIDYAEAQLREKAAASKAITIEGATLQVVTGNSAFYKKNTPQNEKDTLFLFTDNLQAYLYYAPKEVQEQYANLVEAVSDTDYPKLLDVGSTSAIIRTVSKGSTEQTPNAIGFVVKKNAMIGGRFSNEDSDQFQDSDSGAFRAINLAVAQRIKQMIKDNGYKAVRIVGSIAGEKARLTRKNAEILQEILRDELGIETTIKSADVHSDKWYKLEVLKNVRPRKATNAKDAAATKEALESLKKTAPKADTATLEQNRAAARESNRDILATTYPIISERRARVDYILDEFRDYLSDEMDYWIGVLEDMRDNNPEQFDSMVEGSNRTYRDLLNGLTMGTEAQNRVFALKEIRVVDEEGSHSMMNYLINKIYQDHVSTVEAAFESIDDKEPRKEWVEEFASKVLLNEGEDPLNLRFGDMFAMESADKGWKGQRARKEALLRARKLAYEFRKMTQRDVFRAIVKDMQFDLGILENLYINDIYDEVSNSQTDEHADDISEEKVDANKEGYMVKYKLLDPKTTQSVRMKNLLSTLYKTKATKGGAIVHTYDDMGRAIKVSAGEAYYTILDAFNDVITEEDMDDVMADLNKRCPWLFSVYTKVCQVEGFESEFDFDLRREFYTTFLQARTEYVKMQGSFFVYCNKDADVATFLKHTSNNIEGHIVLGPHSIYNEDGQINMQNVREIGKLFEHGKVLDKVLKVLRGVNVGDSSVEQISKALDTLRENDLLKNLLNDLGISTDNIDLDAMMPDKELEDYKTLSGYDVNAYVNDIGAKNLRGLQSILSQIQVITRKGDGINDESVLTERDIPTVKFAKAYTIIGGALKEPSDGYTMQSFRGPDGNSRFSYTAPDFVSIMTRAISRDDAEKARQYIIDNWGHCDYYRDQAVADMRYGWRNQILADFMQSENEPTNWRRDFESLQLLSMLDSKGRNTQIKDVQPQDMLVNLFLAYRGYTASKSGVTLSYFRNPLFSDVDATVLFKGRRYTGDNYMIDIAYRMVEVFEQEYARIQDIKTNPGDVKIENYNTGKNNAEKFVLLPELNKGIKEADIPGFDEIKATLDAFHAENEGNPKAEMEVRRAYIAGIMADLLNYKFEQFITDSALQLDDALVTRLKTLMNKQDNYAGRELTDEEITESLLEDEEATEKPLEDELAQNKEEVVEALREFFYNDFFMQSQLIQLLGGDLAYYKDLRDFIKRNKQSYASGRRMYAMDKDGNRIMEKCLYVEDLEGTVNDWQYIQKLLREDTSMPKMVKDLLIGSVNQFMGGVTKTDGQSLRTLKSFKKIFEACGGTWSQQMEIAYQNIMNGTLTHNEFQALWNQIKPFVYTYETIQVGNRMERVPVQHKNSEYLLSAAFTALQMSLNKSPELVALHKFMEDNDIDVVHFHSVVKVGYHDGVDINHDDKRFKQDHPNQSYEDYTKSLDKQLKEGKITQEAYNEAVNKYRYRNADEAYKALEEMVGTKDEKGNPLKVDGKLVMQPKMIKTFDIKDIMFAQPSADHLTDAEALIGSQLKNIMPADLPEDFTMTVTVNGQSVTLNREESIAHYNQLLVDMMLHSFQRVSNEFSDIESLQAALYAKMENNPKFGPDVRQALEIVERNGKKTFKLPFISPNLTNKIEDLILSTFKNAIQKQRIKGGNIVLVSSYGLDDTLHVQWKNARTGRLILTAEERDATPKEDLAVAYIPCYMPFFSSEMLQDFLEQDENGYYNLDFKKMEKELGKSGAEKLLEVIGYRIPTEDKYSIMPIKIMGFLPEHAGKSIMLPADIITMSGTDFDIDKLFLMIRAFRRELYSTDLVNDYIEWLNKTSSDKKQEKTDKLISSLLGSLFGIQEEALAENPNATRNSSLQEALQILLDTKSTRDEATVKRMLKAIKKERKGFTDQEIASLIGQSETFKTFMEEGGGANSRFAKPQYRIVEPTVHTNEKGIDLSATSANASMDELHNMFIESVWNMLTTNAVSKLSMLPGGFPNVKHSSRVERIKHDKEAIKNFIRTHSDLIAKHGGSVHRALVSMSTEELDAFFDEYASTQSPLSIQDYVANFRNLMDGGDLIGRLAVNSSSHYKYQFLGLKLSPEFQFKTRDYKGNIITVTDVHPVTSPITGLSIGRICAEAQAASPDNGKDPCLGDLNISPFTVSFVAYLMSVGLPWTCIGAINTSGPIVAIGNDMANELARTARRQKRPLLEFVLDEDKISDLMIKYQTSENVDAFKQSLTQEEREYLMDYANWFIKSQKGDGNVSPTKLLSDSTSVSRCDSPNGAMPVSIAEAVQQRAKMENFEAEAKDFAAPIKGFTNMVDLHLDPTDYENMDALREKIMKAPIPRLQASYTLGILGAHSIAKQVLPQLQDAAYDAFQFLRSQTQRTYLSPDDVAKLKGFYSSMLMYALSTAEIFAGTEDKSKTLMERRNFYIHDFPMQFKAKLEEKDERGRYVYRNVRALNIIGGLANKSGRGITFEHIGSLSKEARKQYQEELMSMLYMGQKEAELAMQLFLYSYYDNGLAFRHNSFGLFFVTSFMEVMPHYIDGLEDAQNSIIHGDKKMADSQGATNTTYMQNFVLQYLMNHVQDIPRVKGKDFNAYEAEKNEKGQKVTTKIVLTESGAAKMSSSANAGGLIQLVRANRRVYRLIDPEKAIYTLIDYSPVINVMTDGMQYYDANSLFYEIDYSALQNRGAIAKVPASGERRLKAPVESKEPTGMKIPTEGAVTSTIDREIRYTPMEQNWDNTEIPHDPDEMSDTRAQASIAAADQAEAEQAEREEKIRRAAEAITHAENMELAARVPVEDNKDLSSIPQDNQTNLCPPTGK